MSTGTRCRCACVALFLLAIVALAAMALLELGTLRGADPGAADPCDLEALSSEMQVQCCSEAGVDIRAGTFSHAFFQEGFGWKVDP